MIKNFLFHRVNPKRERLWDPMDVGLFERCIKYITRNYETVVFEELMNSGNIDPRKKYATIMFDDGYKDNIEYAAPIMKKYGCRGSFYVVTDCIDQNIPTWTHILEHRFQYTNVADLDLQFDFLPEEMRAGSLGDTESRIAYVTRLKPFLKKLTHEQRNPVLDHVNARYSDVTLPRIMMDWNDLKQLMSEGHYIGSHTVTHCMLGTMKREEEIAHELTESGNRIKEQLGFFPETISYPVGSFNETTLKIAEQTGYRFGLAVKQRNFYPEKEGIYEVSRIELYNESWWKTHLRITNTFEKIKKIMGK